MAAIINVAYEVLDMTDARQVYKEEGTAMQTMCEPLDDVELERRVGHKFMLHADSAADSDLEWIHSNLNEIQDILTTDGALVIRGLDIAGSKRLERVLSLIFGGPLMAYTYRSTPRTKLRGHIYTSTEYHAEEVIELHNENAYTNRWPANIAFYCAQPATEGGQTPIADSHKIYSCIPEEIRCEFERRQLLYVRNYGDVDLPWQEVFQTNDKRDVEGFCKQNGIQFDWIGEHGLQTKQLRPATLPHPRTGKQLWFNQAHLFHPSSLKQAGGESVISVLGEFRLPRNVLFGDGEKIADEIFVEIRAALKKNMISFNWNQGDLLLLDNMRYAHGRNSFKGNRRVLTGMSGQIEDCSNKWYK